MRIFSAKQNLCALLLYIALLAGCGSAAPKHTVNLSVEQLWSGTQCGFTEKNATVISDEHAFHRTYSKLQQAGQGANATDIRQIRRKQIASDLPQVDWQSKVVLLLAMGQRGSAGYSLSLATTEAMIKDEVLSATVVWQQPMPGLVQAQVVTSPCLLLAIPRDGYQRIEVMDELEPPVQRWLIAP